MPEQVILHTGPHKTGSSGLQQMFMVLRPALAERGVVYPQAGLDGAAHHGVVDHLRGRAKAEVGRALIAEAEGARVLLLSSENFTVLPVSALLRLRGMFPEAQFTVVHLLRRLCDLWPSHWQELVKHGQSLSFPEYLAQAAMGWPESGWTALNQPDQLGKLVEAFGTSGLRLIGYDAVAAAGADIGAAVLREGLELPGLVGGRRAPRLNLRMHDWKLELLRLLHRIAAERGGRPPGGRIGQALDARLERSMGTWLDDFRARVAAAPVLDLDSQGPLIFALQQAVISRFGGCLTGDRLEAERHYLAPVMASVPIFDLPRSGTAALLAEIEALGAELSESGGQRDGPG